jgi:uncharacterized protein YkwD
VLLRRAALVLVAGMAWLFAAEGQRGLAQKPSGRGTFEAEVVRLTNLERTQRGLQPLRWNGQLNDAARGHAADMARQSRLAHVLDGQDPGDRIDTAGYRWASYGENIAVGYPTARAVVAGWMNSPGHRQNILNPSFTEIGIAAVSDDRGRPYSCQVFARPQ